MEQNEILKQIDSRLWPLPEVPYTQTGQWFWYDVDPKEQETEPLNIICGGQETLKPAAELKRQSLLGLAGQIKQSSKHTTKAERTYRQCRKFIDDNFIIDQRPLAPMRLESRLYQPAVQAFRRFYTQPIPNATKAYPCCHISS